jgi:hypothetical protein
VGSAKSRSSLAGRGCWFYVADGQGLTLHSGWQFGAFGPPSETRSERDARERSLSRSRTTDPLNRQVVNVYPASSRSRSRVPCRITPQATTIFRSFFPRATSSGPILSGPRTSSPSRSTYMPAFFFA